MKSTQLRRSSSTTQTTNTSLDHNTIKVEKETQTEKSSFHTDLNDRTESPEQGKSKINFSSGSVKDANGEDSTVAPTGLKVFDHVIHDEDRNAIATLTSEWETLKTGYLSISRDFVWTPIFVHIKGSYLFLFDAKDGNESATANWWFLSRSKSNPKESMSPKKTLIMYCCLENANLGLTLNETATSISRMQIDIMDKADIRIATLLFKVPDEPSSENNRQNECSILEKYRSWVIALQMAGCEMDLSQMEQISNIFDSLENQENLKPCRISSDINPSQSPIRSSLSYGRRDRRRSSTFSNSGTPLSIIKEISASRNDTSSTTVSTLPVSCKIEEESHDNQKSTMKLAGDSDPIPHSVTEIVDRALDQSNDSGTREENDNDVNKESSKRETGKNPLRLLKESFASFRLSQSLKPISKAMPEDEKNEARASSLPFPGRPRSSSVSSINGGMHTLSNHTWLGSQNNVSSTNLGVYADHPEDLFGPAPSIRNSISPMAKRESVKGPQKPKSNLQILRWDSLFRSLRTEAETKKAEGSKKDHRKFELAVHHSQQSSPSQPSTPRQNELRIRTPTIMPLQTHLSLRSTRNRDLIPAGFIKVLRVIEELGLNAEGIYRISGNGTTVDRLRQLYLDDPDGFDLTNARLASSPTAFDFVTNIPAFLGDTLFKNRLTHLSGSRLNLRSSSHASPVTMEGRSKRMSSLSVFSQASSHKSIPHRTSWDVPDPVTLSENDMPSSGKFSFATLPSARKRHSLASSLQSAAFTGHAKHQRASSLTFGAPLEFMSYNSDLFDHDVHVLASFVKRTLREGVGSEKEPVFPYRTYRETIQAVSMDISDDKKVQRLKSIVNSFPDINYAMLEVIMRHLRNVVHHDEHNLMSPKAIATIFGPTLLQRPLFDQRVLDENPGALLQATVRDAKLQAEAVRLVLDYLNEIFAP